MGHADWGVALTEHDPTAEPEKEERTTTTSQALKQFIAKRTLYNASPRVSSTESSVVTHALW
jgi:hypothetical protein